MTIKHLPCITLACNGCGTNLEGDGFVMHFADVHEALTMAAEQMWTGDAQVGTAWCPRCQTDAEDGEGVAACICGCPLGRPCVCDSSADHGDPRDDGGVV